MLKRDMNKDPFCDWGNPGRNEGNVNEGFSAISCFEYDCFHFNESIVFGKTSKGADKPWSC